MLNSNDVDYIETTLDRIALFPVILCCPRCSSGNVITNSNCVSCGAPMGDAVEDVINEHREKYQPQKQFSDGNDFFRPDYNYSGSSGVINLSSQSSIGFAPITEYPTLYGVEPTPVYNKCPNCSSLIDLRSNKTCPQCGVLSTINEEDYGYVR